MKRRAPWHDYRGKQIYMITITTNRGAPPLSFIQPTGATATTVLTPLGRLVEEEIRAIPAKSQYIQLMEYVVMPDHLHLLIHVFHELPRHLGVYISRFMGACSRAWRDLRGDSALLPLYEEGYNDRILMRRGQLDTLRRYILDNPRRLMIKRRHPDLFRRNLRLQIGGNEYDAVGNLFLLRDFDRRAVIIHRRWSASEREAREKEWLETVLNGGVLVSPFISPAEKQLREKAIESGGRLILLREEGFGEKYKPAGRDFDLCAAGRLLILSPCSSQVGGNHKISRSGALRLNSLAEDIASLDASSPLAIRMFSDSL